MAQWKNSFTKNLRSTANLIFFLSLFVLKAGIYFSYQQIIDARKKVWVGLIDDVIITCRIDQKCISSFILHSCFILPVFSEKNIFLHVEEWSSKSIEGSIISCLCKVSSCFILTLVVRILDTFFTLLISKLYVLTSTRFLGATWGLPVGLLALTIIMFLHSF